MPSRSALGTAERAGRPATAGPRPDCAQCMV